MGYYHCNIIQVRRCEACQRNNQKFDKPSPMLHPIPVSDTWKKVGIDLIQLPKSRNSNQYCITLTDYFSKWPEAEAVPTKEASHVAAFLLKMIFRHGCPEEIVSDQGTEFCNQLIDLLEKQTGFKHKVTSAYHPQSNGLDERMNQTFKSKLRKLVNEEMDDWDEHLDNILFAYRSSRHDTTNCTPFLLMYGREARLPVQLSGKKAEVGSEENFESKLKGLQELRRKVHANALANISKAQERQKKHYDKKHNTGTKIKVEDMVLVKDMSNEGRKGGKLKCLFPGGPYTVAQDLGKGRYRLKNKDGVILKTAINYHRLKKWLDPEGGKHIPQKKVLCIIMTIFSSFIIHFCHIFMQPLPHKKPNSPPSRSHKPSPDIDQLPVRENELTDVKSQVKMISQCAGESLLFSSFIIHICHIFMQPLPHKKPNSPPSRSHKPSPDIDQPPVRENELTDVKSQVKMISQCAGESLLFIIVLVYYHRSSKR